MQRVKTYLKSYIKIIVRFLAHIFFLFPIKNNTIMFSAFMGEKVTCNPKRVYDYFRAEYPGNYKYIWTYNKERAETSLDDTVQIVKRFSIRWFYYRLTSQIIVDNCSLTYAVPKRKGQYIVQTWHAGGAYKKVGGAASKYEIEKRTMNKAMSAVDLFVSSSRGFTEGNIIEGYHYTGEVLDCGMPRNDIFFDNSKVMIAANKVRNNYSLEGPVVLYAPTFRGNVNNANKIESMLDLKLLQQVLNEKYGERVTILVRYHHWDKNDYGFDGSIVNVQEYPDMQELLCASDILITDYSSSMWDYALLGRPCLLYTPDVDQYIKSRGFFTPIEQWPGIVCKNMDELCEAVKNLDRDKCAKIAKKHLELMGSYETGHATEAVCNRILQYISEDKA